MPDKTASKEYRKVSVGGWMGTIILSCIPVLNFIMWLIWAFSAKRPSRRTFAGACLILTLLCAALAALIITLFGAEILDWARSIDPELFTRNLAG